MKAITIAGNVTKDAETRDTRSGSVTSFGVAVNRRGKEDGALFFDVAIFGKRGEALKPHINKGGKITVTGDFDTREHEGRTYLKLTANDVTLQGGGRQSGGGSSYSENNGPQGDGYGGHDDADSIPF